MIKKLPFKVMSLFKSSGILTLLIVVGYSCSNGEDGQVIEPLGSAKAITAFSFLNPAITGVIDETTHTISVTFPVGTDLTSLAATFTTTEQK